MPPAEAAQRRFFPGFTASLAHKSFRLKCAHEFNALNEVPEALKA
jgi:hypothetical protein